MIPDGYRRLGKGARCEIWTNEDTYAILAKAPPKNIQKARQILVELAESGRDDLNREQFRDEGRYSGGSAARGDYAVYAVKSYQLRIYGGYVGENDAFFVCEIALIKKKNEASKTVLERVARALGELDERLG